MLPRITDHLFLQSPTITCNRLGTDLEYERVNLEMDGKASDGVLGVWFIAIIDTRPAQDHAFSPQLYLVSSTKTLGAGKKPSIPLIILGLV